MKEMQEPATYQLVTPFQVPVREHSLPPERKPVDVIRVYPILKRTTEELISDLENGLNPEDINYFSIIFMEKSDDNNSHLSYISPIGGPINANESPLLAAYRNLMEKTTYFPMEFPTIETLNKHPYHITDTLTYRIAHSSNRHPRNAYISVIEVTELEGRKPEIITPAEQAKKLIAIPSRQASEKILGIIPSNLIGSSRVGLSEDIVVTANQQNRKDNLLQGLNYIISQKEEHFKMRLLSKINALRRTDITSSASTGDEINIVTISSPIRGKKREIYHNETAGRQVDILLRLNDADPEEIVTAFNHLKKQDMMRTFREIETQKGIITFERNLGANLGKDLLYYAQIFAGHEGEDFTSLAAKTDRATINTLRLMRDIFRSSLYQTFIDNPEMATALYPLDEQYSAIYNLENDTTKSFKDKQELSRQAMKPLIDLYLKTDAASVKLQLELEKKLSDKIVDNLAQRFQLNPADVITIKKQSNRMQSELIDAALSSDPEFANIYQLHRTLNEVQNANFAQLLFLDLGILPQEVEPGVMQLTRFEASRLTVQILKGLTGFNRHTELTKDENIAPFQKLVSIVYGPVVRQEEVELHYKDGVIKQTLLYRKGPQGIEVIVDEKDKKSLLSYIRKSFQEKHETIFDGISFNIALAHEGDILTYKTASSSINRMDKLIKRFHDTALGLYQNEYDVVIQDDKNNYENLLNFLQQQESGEVIISDKEGKRAGSIANCIIRRKFIMELRNKKTGKSAYCEFVFYPFTELAEQTNGEFLGLNEKLVDAKGYEFRRITSSLDPTRIGFPSGYDLTNPTPIYERAVTVYEHRRKHERKKHSR